MKRTISLTLAVVMAVALFTGCSAKKPAEKTPEELTTLFTTAIESARDQELNDAIPVLNSPEGNFADVVIPMLGASTDDMTAYAVAISAINMRAYGIAAIRPAADKEDAVKEGLQAFIDAQQASFEFYLPDQYEVAKAAKLETLSDGTVLMVMCEGQDEVFTAIKDAIEKG